jgi:hypothetical protein
VSRAGHDRQVASARQVAQYRLVELEYLGVSTADDEQDRRAHVREQRTRQVGSATARHHRADAVLALARGHQRGRRPGAGAEQAARQPPGRLSAAAEPVDGHDQAPGEQEDVEAQLTAPRVDAFLVRRQQVEKQRAEASVVEARRHRLVPRRAPGTAAAVGEQHDTRRSVGNGEIAG